MKKLPNWNISHDSARRLSGLLDKAAELGIDTEAVTEMEAPLGSVAEQEPGVIITQVTFTTRDNAKR